MSELFEVTSSIASPYSAIMIVFNIVSTFVLSLVVAQVYRATHRGVAYSQSFIFTLVFLSVIVSLIMMVIGNNLARAFGLVGAFYIIRFRTAIKESRDVAYVFFALAVGMAMGTNNYLIGAVVTGMIIILVLILNKFNFGTPHEGDHIFRYKMESDMKDEERLNDLFKNYFRNKSLLNIQAQKGSKDVEIAYKVTFLKNKDPQQLLREMSYLKGVGNVRIFSTLNDIEY